VRALRPMHLSERRRVSASLLAALFIGPLGVFLWASSAEASPSGTVQETINVAVRSLTVSPGSVGMCSSTSPLTSPNGLCQSPTVTITNGQAAGNIDVSGANAVPSDESGNDWTLYSSLSGPPGVNQYEEGTYSVDYPVYAPGSTVPAPGALLTTTPQCDLAISNESCYAQAGQASHEYVELEGPSSSSDQSPIFSTSVTWTAAP
jgi:hypothetical protein